MGNTRGKDKYYLGLDMGTTSVGWAVTDDRYEIIKRHGKALWGIRLFEQANTAEERRAFRTARRRTERRKNRISLLQQLFSEEIAAKDPGFFVRMKESKYIPEDKRDLEGKRPELPYTLFADQEFTDVEFHKQFPTIYHLRYALITQMNEKPDIRLLYLALHHILKHRGHFLFEGKEISEGMNFSAAVEVFLDCLEENGIELSEFQQEDKIRKLEEILTSSDSSRTEKKKQLCDLFAGKDKQKMALAGLIAGCKVKLSVLFDDRALDEEERSEISFSDDNYEEYISQVEEILGDRFLLILSAKAIFDWSILSDILGTCSYLSEAKIQSFEKHKRDLNKLKNLLRKDRACYRKVFGEPGKTANYSAYVGMVKKNGKKQPINKNCSREDFYKFLKKTLQDIPCAETDRKVRDEMLEEIEKGTLFPKQILRDNAVIPYQLHEKELNKILENAVRFYPFLEKIDEDGYSVSQKIKEIFRFRIPYFVGPINTYHKEKGGNSWAVRIGNNTDKIYPWNFSKKIDEEQSAEKFIKRMTNKCTYLLGEDVLPKESLLYAKFNVLNELNNLRIDGELVSVEMKKKIYHDVFKRHKRVTGKRVKDYLIREGLITKEQELSGFDQNFKSSLKAYMDIKQITTGISLTEQQQEDIILDITLFADSPKMLKRRIKQKYPQLSDKQVTQLSEKKYSGWGRLSRAFLEEVEAVNPETGVAMNLITALWETNDNLMRLLSKKYSYAEEIEKRNAWGDSESEISYQTVQDLYVSPAVRRPIWQALKIVKEIEHIMGSAPERIFVEMAREPGKKGERKISRKSRLQELYRFCKKEASELYDSLSQKDDNELRSDKLYLYYTQMGRCMYSNEVIDMEELFTNRYDIDHIYPASKVMDDSLDNRVLVKSERNRSKSDTFPVPESYVKQAGDLWRTLLEKGLISKEKYHRLTRRDSFSTDELAGFIARQLVETRQSTKAVTQILNKAYPKTEIVYAKAKAVSDFRQQFDLIKVRDLNDHHHAKDAYLDIVVGNTYYVKFTKDASWFVKNNPGRTYNLKKMFENDVKRGDEIAWTSGGKGTIHTVKKWMRKNNILFTRKAYEVKGGLFDQQLVKKGKGQVPVKGNVEDTRLASIEKYGGYNKASGAYFILVQSDDKKGNPMISFKFVPVYLAQKLEESQENMLQYCRGELELINPRILIPKIKMGALLEVNGFRMHLSGRTDNRLLFKGANQLVVSENIQKTIKKVGKVCADYAINKNVEVSDKMGLNEEELMRVYDTFDDKLKNTIYGNQLSAQIDALENGKEKFVHLSKVQQCLVLNEILHLFQCRSVLSDFTLIGGFKRAGTIRLNSNISKLERVFLINQSITGFYEQVIDLKAL